MKKLFGILAIAVLFASCKKEEIKPQLKVLTATELNGTWIEADWKTMTISGTDTTYVNGEYVGDGVCCNVTEINVQGSSYTTGSMISVDGEEYVIIKAFNEDVESISENYSYYLDIEIETPYSGCQSSLKIFKRAE